MPTQKPLFIYPHAFQSLAAGPQYQTSLICTLSTRDSTPTPALTFDGRGSGKLDEIVRRDYGGELAGFPPLHLWIDEVCHTVLATDSEPRTNMHHHLTQSRNFKRHYRPNRIT